MSCQIFKSPEFLLGSQWKFAPWSFVCFKTLQSFFIIQNQWSPRWIRIRRTNREEIWPKIGKPELKSLMKSSNNRARPNHFHAANITAGIWNNHRLLDFEKRRIICFLNKCILPDYSKGSFFMQFFPKYFLVVLIRSRIFLTIGTINCCNVTISVIRHLLNWDPKNWKNTKPFKVFCH